MGTSAAATLKEPATERMQTLATGAAFVDRSGAVIAADAGFLAELGLAAEDAPRPCASGPRRAPPSVRSSRGGAYSIRLAGADGVEVELERVSAGGGALLLARSPRTTPSGSSTPCAPRG